MTDFHKLFLVKVNKMIKKKTEGIFSVVYVIHSGPVYTNSKKTVFCFKQYSPTTGFIPYMQLSKDN